MSITGFIERFSSQNQNRRNYFPIRLLKTKTNVIAWLLSTLNWKPHQGVEFDSVLNSYDKRLSLSSVLLLLCNPIRSEIKTTVRQFRLFFD